MCNRGYIFAKLVKALVIARSCNLALPSSFGLGLPRIFQKLHACFAHVAPDIRLELLNQDLVGFLTRIPVDRTLKAILYVLQLSFPKRMSVTLPKPAVLF